MLFTSLKFAVFLPVAFALYWLLRRRLRWQNLLVLVASYVFYGCWEWRFLLLIAFTSGCSYLSGLAMSKPKGGGKSRESVRKVALYGNLMVNLGILGLFKYYDFFAAELARLMHVNADAVMLHLVLPVGISFYTFQALSYTIDVYRGKLEPTRDAVAFFAYIAFFPQLVAGPIERAPQLLPQFQRRRVFDYTMAVDGCRQILWGLFKKMVVADNCASYVDQVWGWPHPAAAHVLAAVLFSFQIYGDFSGYSDIAIGTAKLFGLRLMQNFRVPYFSRDIAEFWRRWHISLTTWFRDYLYIPLGGSRVARWKVVRNTFVIFIVSGLWHGANWTFIVWGLYHACLFVPLIVLGRNRRHTDTVAAGRRWPSLREAGQMTLTFALVTVGWVIFRATGLHSCLSFLFAAPHCEMQSLPASAVVALVSIAVLLVIEWANREEDHGLVWLGRWRSRPARCFVFAVLFLTVLFFRGDYAQFLYFQF